MDQLYCYSGSIRTMTLNKSHFTRFGPFWREAPPRLWEKREYDTQGRLLLRTTEEYSEHYAYLENDSLAALYRFSQDDEFLNREVYYYREDGSLESCDCFDAKTLTSQKSFQEQRGLLLEKEGHRIEGKQFDRQGRLRARYIYHGSEADLVIKYHYSREGWLMKKEEQDKMGCPVKTTEFKGNSAGLPLEEKVMDKDGTILTKRFFSYPGGEDANWLVREEYGLKGRDKKVPLTVIYRDLNFYHSPRIESLSAPTAPSGVDTSTKSQPMNPNKPEPGQIIENKKMVYSNGYYLGQVEEGIMEGEGAFHFNDGALYKGSFSRGKMDGPGIIKNRDGSRYKGQFSQGRMEGKGIMIWSDGSRYEGPFRNGLMEGIGIFTWPNGDRFKGLFEKGKRTDQGLLEPASPTD